MLRHSFLERNEFTKHKRKSWSTYEVKPKCIQEIHIFSRLSLNFFFVNPRGHSFPYNILKRDSEEQKQQHNSCCRLMDIFFCTFVRTSCFSCCWFIVKNHSYGGVNGRDSINFSCIVNTTIWYIRKWKQSVKLYTCKVVRWWFLLNYK